MLTRKDFQELSTREAAPAVSIYLPTHVAGREIRQDPIRLRNLLAAAEKQLAEAGHRRPDVAALLAPAHALVDDPDFWRHQSDGLAVFVEPGDCRIHRVPLAFEEQLVIGQRYHLKPLLPVLANDGRFFVLAITLGRVRLFEATKFAMTEKHPDSLPESVAGVVGQVDFSDRVHFHPTGPTPTTGGTPTPKYHALGDSAEDVREMEMQRFLERLAHAVTDYLTPEAAPLVVAAGERLQGHFRGICQYRWLLDEWLDVDPEALETDELHRRAYELITPHLEAARERDCDRFRALAGDGSERATTDVGAIATDAAAGRLETLFVAEDTECWGRVDDRNLQAERHRTRQDGDEDLLNYAATHALGTGASVYVVPADRIPADAPAAAVRRY